MAVVSCTFDVDDPVGGTSDERNRGTYVVRYRIVCDSLMGPKEVAAGALSASPNALPAQWDTYAFQGDADSNAFAQAYDFKMVPDKRMHWQATVTFSPLPDGVGDVAVWKDIDPFARGVRFWWDREVYSEVIERDIFGKEMVNTAGQTYDEPLEQEASRSVLVAEWNVATLSEVVTLARTYENAVNSLTWTPFGAEPRTVLCREITSSQRITEGANNYYTVIARLAFAEVGRNWDRGVLSRGFKHLALVRDPKPNEPNIQLVQAADAVVGADGKATGEYELVNEPVLLDVDGYRLPKEQPGIFTFWRTRREVDFNNLPIS